MLELKCTHLEASMILYKTSISYEQYGNLTIAKKIFAAYNVTDVLQSVTSDKSYITHYI